jgi:hypothetical protein
MVGVEELFQIKVVWYQNASGYIFVMGPLFLPSLGISIGLFKSFSKRKELINNENQSLIA